MPLTPDEIAQLIAAFGGGGESETEAAADAVEAAAEAVEAAAEAVEAVAESTDGDMEVVTVEVPEQETVTDIIEAEAEAQVAVIEAAAEAEVAIIEAEAEATREVTEDLTDDDGESEDSPVETPPTSEHWTAKRLRFPWSK